MTTVSADDARLLALPADLRPLFIAALQAKATAADGWDSHLAQAAVWTIALRAAGFVGTDTPVPLASQLSERQRLAMTLYAAVPGVGVFELNHFMPAWAVRQWLGLEEAGPLFQPDERGVAVPARTSATRRSISSGHA